MNFTSCSKQAPYRTGRMRLFFFSTKLQRDRTITFCKCKDLQGCFPIEQTVALIPVYALWDGHNLWCILVRCTFNPWGTIKNSEGPGWRSWEILILSMAWVSTCFERLHRGLLGGSRFGSFWHCPRVARMLGRAWRSVSTGFALLMTWILCFHAWKTTLMNNFCLLMENRGIVFIYWTFTKDDAIDKLIRLGNCWNLCNCLPQSI